MMKRALLSDWVKMRRTWIKFLVILGPVGVVGLNAMRSLQHRGSAQPADDAFNWALLIQNISHLLLPSLMLGIALIVSLLVGLEHQGHAWKQLFALPVSRAQLYASKFVWVAGLLGVSAALCAVGTIGLGLASGFATHIPWAGVLKQVFYPYFAAYGVIAIQLLLSMLFANQSFALTLGVLGAIFSGLTDALSPDGIAGAHAWAPLVPWSYPSLSSLNHAAVQHTNFSYVIYGLAVGAVVTVAGMRLFARKEVR